MIIRCIATDNDLPIVLILGLKTGSVDGEECEVRKSRTASLDSMPLWDVEAFYGIYRLRGLSRLEEEQASVASGMERRHRLLTGRE